MADGQSGQSGVWWPGMILIPAQASAVYREGERQGIGASIVRKPVQAEVMAKAKTLSDKDDPALCASRASSARRRSSATDMVGEIVQTPKTVVQLIETYHGFRIIPTTDAASRRRRPSNHATRWAAGRAIR